MTKLKSIRIQNNITQKELSEISDIPLTTIQKYESGERDINGANINTLLNLGKVLNVKYYEFLDNELQEKIIFSMLP